MNRMIFGLIVTLTFLSGCAEVPPQSFLTMIDGHLVWEHPGVPCPGLDERQYSGCHMKMSDGTSLVYYSPWWDEDARQHELSHVLGMRHGPWVHGKDGACTEVLVSGKTRWKPGEIMCRLNWVTRKL